MSDRHRRTRKGYSNSVGSVRGTVSTNGGRRKYLWRNPDWWIGCCNECDRVLFQCRKDKLPLLRYLPVYCTPCAERWAEKWRAAHGYQGIPASTEAEWEEAVRAGVARSPEIDKARKERKREERKRRKKDNA